MVKHIKLNSKEFPCIEVSSLDYSYADCIERVFEVDCRPFWTTMQDSKPICQNISQLNTILYWYDWFSYLDYPQLVKELHSKCFKPCTYYEYRVSIFICVDIKVL